MTNRLRTALILVTVIAGGCAEEPPPPSVDEFMQNKILLDAAMVRCTRNRSELKYTAECANAREAANLLAREEEEERRKILEAQSERKRAALRRAQEAADEARRRAEEAARLREEAEYLDQFGTVESEPAGTAVVVDPERATSGESGSDGTAVAVPGAAATPEPGVTSGGDPAADETDLQSIREELERRQNADQPR